MDSFPPITTLFGISIRTFSLIIGLGALTASLAAWRSMRGSPSARHLADVLLAALVPGLIMARLIHVALQWDYFAAHTDEIAQIRAGGLDWHGALIGGLAGAWVASRWRKLSLPITLDAFAPALPIVAAFTWYACASVITAHCGYGAEIATLADAPRWAASESSDVFGIMAPRWNTQHAGMVWSLAVTALILWTTRSGWLEGRRFWLALLMTSAGMFIIGFWRGDAVPMISGLRADQWLDALMIGLAAVGILTSRQARGHQI